MDLFVVDSHFNKTDVVDSFISTVWTERYSDSGEVVLSLPATAANKSLIHTGVFLHTPPSREIMLVDSQVIEKGILTATGRSLADFLKYRLARNTWHGTTSSWALASATAGAQANSIVTQMCIAGGLIDGSVLPSGWADNEVFPNLSVAAPPSGDAISTAVDYGNVFDAIKKICDSDDLGFTLYPPSVLDGTGNVLFKTYRGLDRTTAQTTNGVVIFDEAMESLTNVKELRSISGYRNVAYVWPSGITAQSQIVAVYAPGASTKTGWDRRSMMVDASDVNVADYTSTELAAVLRQRGRDALVNNNYVRMLDGQLVPQDAFVYGTDYILGDVIELRGNSTNLTDQARITEYIRTQDTSGEISYPTLSVLTE